MPGTQEGYSIIYLERRRGLVTVGWEQRLAVFRYLLDNAGVWHHWDDTDKYRIIVSFLDVADLEIALHRLIYRCGNKINPIEIATMRTGQSQISVIASFKGFQSWELTATTALTRRKLSKGA